LPRPRCRMPPAAPIDRMLPALPIDKILPALPIDRMLPLQPIDRMLPKLARLAILAKLNRLTTLKPLKVLFQLSTLNRSRSKRFIEDVCLLDNRMVSIDTTVLAQLDQLHVPYEIFPCDPALADTSNFCAAYGFKPEDSANTILVIGKSEPPVYAACVVLSTTRLDVNRAVRQRLGTRKASFAPAEDTRAITGMEIGGVTVFGLPADLPIWIDARVVERDKIVLGGGSRSSKVIAAPEILLKLSNAEVVEGLATEA
jgi:prolyl-tRNA editing enzyme YbaK/EbsC (Cys-tRNA(Pro) deacylase)